MKYNVILCDPPWSYNDKMRGHTFSLDHEYPTQSLNWIASLPVQDIAAKDCALFLWATNPLLEDAFRVINAWGFKYKTVAFYWVKQTNKSNWAYNLGRWTMGSVEACLLAVRGKPKRVQRNVRQLVIAPRGRHSEKPLEVHSRIVELMGDVPRIELFARQRVPGWDAIGNEIDGMDIRESLKLVAAKQCGFIAEGGTYAAL